MGKEESKGEGGRRRRGRGGEKDERKGKGGGGEEGREEKGQRETLGREVTEFGGAERDREPLLYPKRQLLSSKEVRKIGTQQYKKT